MVNAKKEKKTNPILLFLFAIVIPGIIALVLAVIVLSFAGIDAIGWAKEKGSTIPVISNFVTTEEEATLEEKLTKANETIEKQNEQIDELTRDNESLETIVDDLEMDMKRLENRSINNEIDSDTTSTGTTGVQDEAKKIAGSFRKMDEEKAANIVANLDQNVAIEVLTNLSGDVRGGILAEMEPKRAADLTEAMMAR